MQNLNLTTINNSNINLKGKNYTLNNFQTTTITNAIRYEGARTKAMSVLAYLTRLQVHGAVEKTYKDLHRMHQKSSKRVRISFQRFKALMKQLLDLRLLSTDNNTRNSVHTYTVIFTQAEIQAEIQANENHVESIDTTDVEAVEVCDSNQVTNNNIYNNTRQKVTEVEAIEIAEKLFATMKVSKDVKKTVLDRVKKVACTIDNAGAVAYISKIIYNTHIYYKELYKQIKFAVRKSQNMNSHKHSKDTKIANFRDKNYDYNELELELAGLL